MIEEKRETVAVKTVFQDPQYQNRELEIMKRLNHDSIVRLKYYYLSERRNGTYLHLMMEFLPFSLGRVLKYYSRRGEQMPIIYQQVSPYHSPRTQVVVRKCTQSQLKIFKICTREKNQMCYRFLN